MGQDCYADFNEKCNERRNLIMTEEQRKSIVQYRIDNAQSTLAEVLDHCERGFYNTAVKQNVLRLFLRGLRITRG